MEIKIRKKNGTEGTALDRIESGYTNRKFERSGSAVSAERCDPPHAAPTTDRMWSMGRASGLFIPPARIVSCAVGRWSLPVRIVEQLAGRWQRWADG